ncbi:MAG TPA: class I SAM-dependent methyltransferase, partial [Chthoniobacterales bacterium]|nr:class I SAM-dependent methyltransferase [Chthoniobacterales bacterium]
LENSTSFTRVVSKYCARLTAQKNVRSNAVSSALQAVIESPAPGQNLYDEALFISGWVTSRERGAVCGLRAYVDGRCCAATEVLFPRADIAAKQGLPPDARIAFRMFGRIAPAGTDARDVTLRIAASWGGRTLETVAEQSVRVVPARLRDRPYGDVVSPENETLLHRENIYGSGPPLEQAGAEVSDLLHAYLPMVASVVDVGCGAGAYGPPLIAVGHTWLGLEANAHCCDILARRQLPFRRVDLETAGLPCGDAEYDSAVCIEVVEHTRDPESFVAEIARIIRGRALFSVPNLELLPYLYDWRVVPWHLLEGDHKNFFTRASLNTLLSRFFRRVEIFPYGEHPLRTRDGVPLYVHLFAVADK